MDTEIVVHVYSEISAIKKNKFESILLLIKLEPVIQRLVSQKEKKKYHILIWNLENGTDEPIFREGMETQM